MKKIIALSAVLLLLVALAAVLSSCGEHVCVYDEKFESDGSQHWHKCTQEECPNTTAKKAHSFGSEQTVKPTCTEDGSKFVACEICGYENKTVEAALGHELKAVTVAPTCTENGYTGFSCARSGCSYIEKTEELKGGHSFVETVVPPTCTENGYTEITCKASGCDYSEKKDEVPSTGHDYKTVVIDPTCTEGGYTEEACTRCKDSKGKTSLTDALDHDYKEETVAPTCQEKGYTNVTCTRCDYSEIKDEVDKIDHSFVNESVVDPTCTEEGYTLQRCSMCNEATKKVAYTDALDHDYREKIIEPTCTEKGYTEITCSRCEFEDNKDETEMLPHDYEKGKVIAATCTKGGYTEAVCKECDAPGKVDLVDPLGHTFYDEVDPPVEEPKEGIHYKIVKAATCSESGIKRLICTTCEQIPYVEYGGREEVIPMLDHKTVVVYIEPTCTAMGYDRITCENCNYYNEIQKEEKIAHVYYMEEDAKEGEHYKITKLPSCTKDGVKEYVCQSCKSVTGEENARVLEKKLGHSFTVKIVEAWCGTNGYDEFECEREIDGVKCTETEARQAQGEYRHTYPADSVPLFEATCCDYARFVCAAERDGVVCGREFSAYEGDSIGAPTEAHVYENMLGTTPSTCVTQGYTLYGCVAGNCGTTEKRDYTELVSHRFAQSNASVTVTCGVCKETYMNITAEKISQSDKLCICGKTPCVCGDVSADLDGYVNNRSPYSVIAGETFTVTEVELSTGAVPLEMGGGMIVVESDEEAEFTVILYSYSGDAEVEIITLTFTASDKMINLREYENISKVEIDSNKDLSVSLYKKI